MPTPVTNTDSYSASKEQSRSSRRINYRESNWHVHEFQVSSGCGVICRVATLSVEGALLVWVGGEGPPALGAVALALPARAGAGEGSEPLASVLTGAGGEAEAAAGLSRRLARALARPVHVCCGAAFDRFTAPLVERGLIAEIKSRPEYF